MFLTASPSPWEDLPLHFIQGVCGSFLPYKSTANDMGQYSTGHKSIYAMVKTWYMEDGYINHYKSLFVD